MRFFSFVIFALLLSSSVLAASYYDPKYHWGTVESTRFRVHYPDDSYNLAVRVLHQAEDVLDDVTELFAFVPDGPIDIVINDQSDSANGSAAVFPKNTLRLYLTAPTELTGLASYDDWLKILIIHELAHICDLDQTWGFTRFLRWIFGKSIEWNAYTPQFLSEGVAVYAETMLSTQGRGRSSYVAMLLRMAALEKKFISIDQAHIEYNEWPFGNAAYFYGGMFHLWLKDKYGKEAVAKLHHNNAAMPLPYIYWFSAGDAFGKTLDTLWHEWQRSEIAVAKAVQEAVEAEGVTISKRLTSHGRNINGATYSPSDDFIIYSRMSAVDGSTVRKINRDGSEDKFLVLQTFSPRFAFMPDGQSFVFSQNAINERFNNYSDLYRYDFHSKKVVAYEAFDEHGQEIKTSLRARDPDISLDGKRMVFVQNAWQQNKLTLATIDGDKLYLRTLVPELGDSQHASPRFSPDGSKIVVSTWFEGGRRDLVLLDALNGEFLQRITYDEALDGNPTWSHDGRYILYESDRSGISNIYAYDTLQKNYYKVTNVLGGAFQPDVSHDGQFILFRNVSGIGFDIHEMPFRPDEWQRLEINAQEFSAVSDGLGKSLKREEEIPLQLRTAEQVKEYTPWSTLLPFQYNWNLIPSIYSFSGDVRFDLATLGQDILNEHGYLLSVGTSVQTGHFNYAAEYRYDGWYPTFYIGGSEYAVAFRDQLTRNGYFATYLPIKQRHFLALTYSFQHRSDLNTENNYISSNNGHYGFAELGYNYRYVQVFPYSVGAEHGTSFSVASRFYSRALGADFNEVLLSADNRFYLNNPWIKNHVLALRLVVAVALGPDFQEQFFLGGAQAPSLFTVQTDRVYPLRGFAADTSLYPEGVGLLAAYAEYRFPILQINHGISTLPIYFKRLHLAFFTEAGETFGNSSQSIREFFNAAGEQLAKPRVSAGSEVRADISLGWMLPLTLRLGVGVPILHQGRLAETNALFYFNLGTAI